MIITEEMLLKKFNGDYNKANAFMEAYIISLEYLTKETQKLFDPNGQVMISLKKKIDESTDWTFMPLWKKVLVKLSLMKR